MFYSTRLNLLFVAAPKTGSTSVEALLLELDPNGERFTTTLDDQVIDSRSVKTASLGHATASELCAVLGEKRFDSLVTFGFVRHPIDKIVSSYFFTRRGTLSGAFAIRSAKSRWVLVTKRLVSLVLARILPFSMWALIYPMRKCSSYFLDGERRMLVEFLGSTERLGQDLIQILEAAGVPTNGIKAPHLNSSEHAKAGEYFKNHGVLYRLLSKRYADDIQLYNMVEDEIVDVRCVGTSLAEQDACPGLNLGQRFWKRLFDIVASAVGLAATSWLIILAWVLATADTRSNGFFSQERVGREGRKFKAVKIRTMRDSPGTETTVTTASDARITDLGRFWRLTKIDELPQLFNVLLGQMSFVGPRPDVPGYADRLEGEDRVILSMRPGITGPATLKYRHEEQLLASVDDPEAYNRDVIFPDKVRINREYLANWSFWQDIKYILATVFG